jgi:hypothetical protein
MSSRPRMTRVTSIFDFFSLLRAVLSLPAGVISLASTRMSTCVVTLATAMSVEILASITGCDGPLQDKGTPGPCAISAFQRRYRLPGLMMKQKHVMIVKQ